MTDKPRYWMGDVPTHDDFGVPIFDEFVDGKLHGHTAWATMSMISWRVYGIGVLGTGAGQHYKRQLDGRWLKIGG